MDYGHKQWAMGPMHLEVRTVTRAAACAGAPEHARAQAGRGGTHQVVVQRIHEGPQHLLAVVLAAVKELGSDGDLGKARQHGGGVRNGTRCAEIHLQATPERFEGRFSQRAVSSTPLARRCDRCRHASHSIEGASEQTAGVMLQQIDMQSMHLSDGHACRLHGDIASNTMQP